MIKRIIRSAEPLFRQPLVSVLNQRTGNPDYFEANQSNFPQLHQAYPFSFISRELKGGQQHGLREYEMRNGLITTRVLNGPNMSIFDAMLNDDSGRGWHFGQDRQPINPRIVDLNNGNGTGWVRLFQYAGNHVFGDGGGPAFTEDIELNTGAIVELRQPLHKGGFNVLPNEVSIEFRNDPIAEMLLRAEQAEGQYTFGVWLKAVTKISVDLKLPVIQVIQALSNEDEMARSYNAIYHLNQVAEEGTRIIAPIKTLRPRDGNGQMDRWSNDGVFTFGKLSADNAGEQVLYAEPWSDTNGNTEAIIVSKDGESAVSFSWNVHDMPYLTLWLRERLKNPGAAIEPGKTWSTGFDILKAGKAKGVGMSKIPLLPSGKISEVKYQVEVITGKSNVDTAIQRVQSLAKGSMTRITEPFESQTLF